MIKKTKGWLPHWPSFRLSKEKFKFQSKEFLYYVLQINLFQLNQFSSEIMQRVRLNCELFEDRWIQSSITHISDYKGTPIIFIITFSRAQYFVLNFYKTISVPWKSKDQLNHFRFWQSDRSICGSTAHKREATWTSGRPKYCLVTNTLNRITLK